MAGDTLLDYPKKLIPRLIRIGDKIDDDDETKLAHHFLVYMGSLMAVGGIIWGSISYYFDLFFPATIPFGYTLVTILNFIYFHRSKDFAKVRFVQMLISLMLPFIVQWSLGGFVASGGVMLWALLALAASLIFQDISISLMWLIAFVLLTMFTGYMDSTVQNFKIRTPPWVTTLFFVINFTFISAMVFGLSVYLLKKREEAKLKLAEMAEILKSMFGRYLSIEVMNSLIENPAALELGGTKKKVTIMMTDLRGFTAMSERLEPEQVLTMLNSYFEVMVEVILKYNGTINEIIGDALLVIFGAPQQMADRSRRAIACAIEMQNAMEKVNEQNRSLGLPDLEMGIGLNETEVIVGNIGSSKRSKYTVVGSGVNLASRIESYTVGGQILVSESVCQQAGDVLRVDGHREVLPKGAETPLHIYEIGGIAGGFNLALQGGVTELVTLQRPIPLLIAALEGKHVDAGRIKGRLIRLSRKYAEIVLEKPLGILSNLKMNLKVSEGDLANKDFYGKIIALPDIEDRAHSVHFTAVPPEVRAYFQACRTQAAIAAD